MRVLATLLVSGALAACAVQPGASTDTGLQGRWVVTAAEHEGKPMDVVKNGVLEVTGERFHIHTASGTELKGKLQLSPDRKPAQLEFIHDQGLRWEGIYEVKGDSLRINYVTAGEKDPRPVQFSTSSETEASLLMLQKQK